MAEAHEKGNALELAVRAIELAILRASPSYSEKTFYIESNKVMTVTGIRHEIDIWVRVDLGSAYDALFIFECKNWQDKVSKNDIIIFGEKIKAAQAQKGFFVARSFTTDAIAQAAKDPRIQLLNFSDLPVAEVPVPLGFHGVQTEVPSVNLDMKAENLDDGTTAEAVEIERAVATMDGKRFALNEYVRNWIVEEAQRRTNAFRSEWVSEGVHCLPFNATREFQDRKLVVNGQRILQMMFDGEVRGPCVSRDSSVTFRSRDSWSSDPCLAKHAGRNC